MRKDRTENTSGMPIGGWLHGDWGDGRGYPVEIVPFAHGYERGPFHCWALSGGTHPCTRTCHHSVHWRVGMWLCPQHYQQLCRSGFKIVRLPPELLRRLLEDQDG